MADEIEIAAGITEILTAEAVRKRMPEPEVAPVGKCLYCDEKVKVGRRWCDATCRDNWEKENA